MENIKTAGDVLKSKLDPKIIILNNSDYTFNKVIEAMQEYASLQSSKDKERINQLEDCLRYLYHRIDADESCLIHFEIKQALSGESGASKDKEEIERLKQRIAELEKALKKSADLLSLSEQTFTKVAGVIAMMRNVAMRPEDSELSVSEALGVIDIDDSLELASAKIKDHLATLSK